MDRMFEGAGTMAKNPATNLSEAREFAEENAGRTVQAATFGANWMREVAEQSLNQGKVVLEGYLTISREAIDILNRQMSDLGERSVSIAEESISNTFDFAHKLLRVKEPQQLAQLQSEFISSQVQILADQAREAGQTVMRGANEVANTAVRARRSSEAA
jgi:hypothetical protein